MVCGLACVLALAAACQSPTGAPGGPAGSHPTEPEVSATAGAADAGRDQALNLLADLVTANGSCEACDPSTILARMLEAAWDPAYGRHMKPL